MNHMYRFEVWKRPKRQQIMTGDRRTDPVEKDWGGDGRISLDNQVILELYDRSFCRILNRIIRASCTVPGMENIVAWNSKCVDIGWRRKW
jgi:hypothetical protein